MLNDAIEIIENCRSIDELKEAWTDNAENWSTLSKSEAHVLIQTKDRKKAELNPRSWLMDSPILQKVSLDYDPAKPEIVLVDGAPYTAQETKELLWKKLNTDEIHTVHRIKKIFQQGEQHESHNQ